MQFCTDNGGILAEPRRKRETRAINNKIRKHAGNENYWIGKLLHTNELLNYI